MNHKEIKKIATAVSSPTVLNDFVEYGGVGAAIETVDGNIYTGISIDTACSLGFCAEHAAVADMLKHGEYQIKAIVAVDSEGNAVPPCGRCRELISQLSKENLEAVVEVENDTFVLLKEILPYDWKSNRGRKW
ncbi:cytidine deaminase family protein [Peribacillus aracenensis]|uniref:cytidine deaminase family protein n=1 Tax=Peribacillus aracenensis TaxID=2976708 RepID=UPI0021A610CC|nr:cytidine deaminase [Peribacillus sp. BBB004]